MMKRKWLWVMWMGWLAVTLTGIEQGCQDDPTYTTIRGQVLDAGGLPVEGATVTVGSSLTQPSGARWLERLKPRFGRTEADPQTTGVDGMFTLTEVPTGVQRVQIEHPWYFHRVVRLELAEEPAGGTAVSVRLLRKGEAFTFLAEEGAMLQSGRLRVSIPAGALTAYNRPARGEITAYIREIPPDATETGPGPLIGRSADGTGEFPLVSFGMAQVELSQGETPINLADGQSASIELELPSSGSARPTGPEASIPMWHYDEEEGVWQEDPAAIGRYLPPMTEGGSYTLRAEVPHFSTWNWDSWWWQYGNCARGVVVRPDGSTVGGAEVKFWVDGLGTWTTNSLADGTFCMMVLGVDTLTVVSSNDGTSLALTDNDTHYQATYFETLNGTQIKVQSRVLRFDPTRPNQDPSYCYYYKAAPCSMSTDSGMDDTILELEDPALMANHCVKGTVTGASGSLSVSSTAGSDFSSSVNTAFQGNLSIYSSTLAVTVRDSGGEIETRTLSQSEILAHVNLNCTDDQPRSCSDLSTDSPCIYTITPAFEQSCVDDGRESAGGLGDDVLSNIQATKGQSSGAFELLKLSRNATLPGVSLCAADSSDGSGYINDFSPLNFPLKEGDRLELSGRLTSSFPQGSVSFGIKRYQGSGEQSKGLLGETSDGTVATATYHEQPLSGGFYNTTDTWYGRVFSEGNLNNSYELTATTTSPCWDDWETGLSESGGVMSYLTKDKANASSLVGGDFASGFRVSSTQWLSRYQWLCNDTVGTSSSPIIRDMNDWYKLDLGIPASDMSSVSIGGFATFTTVDVLKATSSSPDYTDCLQAKLELYLEEVGVAETPLASAKKALKGLVGDLTIPTESKTLRAGKQYIVRYRVGVERRLGVAGCPTDEATILANVSFRAPYQFQVEIKEIVDSGCTKSLDDQNHEQDDSTTLANQLDGNGVLINGSVSVSAYACTDEYETLNPDEDAPPISADFWKLGPLEQYQTLCVTSLTAVNGLFLEGALFSTDENTPVAWDEITPRYSEGEGSDTVYKVEYCHTNYLQGNDDFYLRLTLDGNSNAYEIEFSLL